MKRDLWQGFVYALQLVLSLISPPVGLWLAAWWLSRWFSLDAWIPMAALIVGCAVSLVTALTMVRAFRRIKSK